MNDTDSGKKAYDVLIRDYTDLDFDSVVDILRQENLYNPASDTRDNIYGLSESDSSHVLVAEVDEDEKRVVGTLFLLDTFWKSMVFNFAVRADYRGHGIGTRLVEEAKKRIANSGADSIEIYIDADHLKARSFFLDNFERVVEKPYKKLFLPLD